MGISKRLATAKLGGGTKSAGGALRASFTGTVDVRKVAERMDKKERRVLYKAAAFARTTMKRGQRKRKKVSSENDYPSAHAGQLRNLVVFSVDANDGSAVVGPTSFKTDSDVKLLGGVQTIPELINSGGSVAATVRGKTVIQSYEPRPFVDKSVGVAAANLLTLMESESF